MLALLGLVALLSQVTLGGLGIGQLLIYAVAVAAGVALLYVALRQFGIDIPAWVIQVFWIIVVAFVVILALRLVFSM